MFSQIAHDNKNNVYCWYDYKGVPSRWVEIMGRHTRKCEGFESIALKQCAAQGIFDAFPDFKKQAEEGFVAGYYLYHLHPIGMGGNLYGKGCSNLSLIPSHMADTLYRFLNGWYYGSLLLKPDRIAKDGHKIFINVPILPAVIGEKDAPFLDVLKNPVEGKKHDMMCAHGHDILVGMQAHQLKVSGLTQETYSAAEYERAKSIYPPKSLQDKIAHTQTIIGGPKKPELITNQKRELIVPDRIRRRS